ncbi:cytochrome P450 [Janthinobacterium sp. PC23-8]|uniref:cytochrome P450 n=1 Tax=Janthinobacterium sp. PC23-8 TaxID=2012679 RepID=UPI0020CC5C0A|nr:cytochrome P450 [Janthinobacterium sp. PC23-8]
MQTFVPTSAAPASAMVTDQFYADPYPAYQALRVAGPLHWSTQFCGGAWLLPNYSDVASVLRDARFSVRRAGGWANSSGPDALAELREFKRIFSRSLLFVDAPQHTRLRQAMNGGFKPAAIQALAPQIQVIVDDLLDKILATPSGRFDFMRDFARPLPALVIATMLDIDGNDRAAFVAWSDDIAAFIGSPTPTIEIARRAQTSLLAMNDYFRALLPARRARPGHDLVSQLILAEAQGGIVTTKQLLAQCCTLLFAGHETTRNLLGNGMLALLQHPQQWHALRHNPSLLPNAIKELLRFDSPVQYSGRRLATDVCLHGQTMKKGQLVIALIGAANRDPAKFAVPDALNIVRNEGSHLSFGHGPHVCIGATLTYMEAEIALRTIMRRMPQLALHGAVPAWGNNAVYRSLQALPLCFAAAPAMAQPECMLHE